MSQLASFTIYIEPEHLEELFPGSYDKLPAEFMEELAERMKDSYFDSLFWSDLEMIALDLSERRYEIPEITSQIESL